MTSLPAGHVLMPGIAIGSLAVVLAAGLRALGLLDRLDGWVAGLMPLLESDRAAHRLPDWTLWLATGMFSLGLAWAILGVPGMWRRVLLWLTSLAVIAGWAPVLRLASHEPTVGPPLVAAVWSGMCALLYARNHLMPSEGNDGTL